MRILCCSLLALTLACSSDLDQDAVNDGSDRCPQTPAGETVDEEGCSAAWRAYARGCASLDQLSKYAAGDLWLLRQAARTKPNAALARAISEQVPRHAKGPFAGLLHRNVPPVHIPPQLGRGLLRMRYYLQAPLTTPPERSLELIREFLTFDADGYVLTHQLIVIPWAEERGLEFPADLKERQREMLAEIEAEQDSDPGFSDLYAERAAFVLAYAEPRPDPVKVRNWIARILSAQLEHGLWTDANRTRVTFDGQTAPAQHSTPHTSALALWALSSYLERYGTLSP